MKKWQVYHFFIIGVMLWLGSVTAHAQDAKYDVFAGYSYGTNDLGCNLSFRCERVGLNGYSAAFTYHFNKNIGLEANFSGHNGTTTTFSIPPTPATNGENDIMSQNIYNYTFGPHLILPIEDFTLFSHFLVGVTHINEQFQNACIQATPSSFCDNNNNPYALAKGNGLAFKTGGGLDWNHGKWGVRVLEVDYIHNTIPVTESCIYNVCAAPQELNISGNSFELSTGLIFHFGKKQ